MSSNFQSLVRLKNNASMTTPRSADALLIAELAHNTRLLVVFTANANESRRLYEEIPWFCPKLTVAHLPDWETLPYEQFSPHQDLVSERLSTLWNIHQGSCRIVLMPISTALQRLAPPEYIAARTFSLTQGERLHLEKFRTQLQSSGYTQVNQVMTPGEYAIRGSLIDLFPMGSVLPFRIDLLDDEIDSIRTFDPDTQRAIYSTHHIHLLPAREFPLDEEGRTRFRQRFREIFEGDPSKISLYKDVSANLIPAGIEYYLPLFFEQTASLFDYLPPDSTLCLQGTLEPIINEFWSDLNQRFKLLNCDAARPLLPPHLLYLNAESFFIELKQFKRINMTLSESLTDNHAAIISPPLVAINRHHDHPLQALDAFLKTYTGRTLLLAESPGRRETLQQLLHSHGLDSTLANDFATARQLDASLILTIGPLHQGFQLNDDSLCILTESELYASQSRSHVKRDAKRTSIDNWVRDLTELSLGQPVVHLEHGIGRYHGLVTLNLGDGDNEFLLIEYAGEDKLYVPVTHLHLISRYTGISADNVSPHRLGSGQWDKVKQKAAEQAWDTAAELLALYAQRAARKGTCFELDTNEYLTFCSGFGFEETPDQKTTIQAVIDDLCSERPMDRLVCGDVGFGKTEVALRAAFIAAMNQRQVVILCPTTLLVEQHYRTFSDRFSDWPIQIAELSRFRTAKETSQAIEQLAQGKIDIVIGTHRLLQKDIHVPNLGLVIIDEEHRFGVRQKEQLKQLRAEIDILSLTATPIPRTLAMAIETMRDFSVIATAPQKRLAVKTIVATFSEAIVREAILRELKRGGQIYFLHNEVATIDTMRDRLEKLVPEAKILVGHGQMAERELERVMREFTAQRYSVLLCTTIIETGIDNPNANTMLINRADKFGLAQLHQLRGRVGRSHHQAYTYLLTPGQDAISNDAQKRLEAIQSMEELGSGFYLAMHDLEIRGAGEVLGESQSGDIQEIGFNLYTEMLDRAVKALKNGQQPDLTKSFNITGAVDLHAPALLPSSYCPDTNERLTLYKRLSNCHSHDELTQLREELIDRFGALPEPSIVLLLTHQLRIMSQSVGIREINASPKKITIQFIPSPPIDGLKMITLIQTQKHIRLIGPEKILITLDTSSITERFEHIRDFIKKITPQ